MVDFDVPAVSIVVVAFVVADIFNVGVVYDVGDVFDVLMLVPLVLFLMLFSFLSSPSSLQFLPLLFDDDDDKTVFQWSRKSVTVLSVL